MRDGSKPTKPPRRLLADYQEAVCQVVSTRQRMWTEGLDFNGMLRAVAQDVQGMTHASAVGIAMLVGNEFVYRTGLGLATRKIGSRVSRESVPWELLVRSGVLGTLPDVPPEAGYSAVWGGPAVRSFLAVPLYRGFTAAGFMELLFAGSYHFEAADIQAAQVMAGVANEILSAESLRRFKIIRECERAKFLAAYRLVQKKFPAAARLELQPAPANQSRSAS